MTLLHLSLPPNIARQAGDDIRARFADVIVREPQTHEEMSDFYNARFGEAQATADLTVTAYPGALTRALTHRNQLAALPADLPPMRPELAKAGLLESHPFFKVIGVVPLLLIHHRDVDPPPVGWADLCRADLAGAVVIPPHSTPAPALCKYWMTRLCGEEGRRAAGQVDPQLFPQDINKAVDEGRYKAGMVFPAFARTFRNGMARAVWPEEGALAVPLIAFVKRGAGPDAVAVLRHLLALPFQEMLAVQGLFAPVLGSAPLFDEMKANGGRLLWMGWEDYASLGAH
ncbi:ABC transporter substrate-binding protein [Desulfatitalea alkaliphila]|uniref:ABC transporter substrate-binding protein n=1 Tax=Desulfatitalea alkaliphila TaxID=2929485 RepID=A0AA41UJX3_9BACT|nr:ABC transporter substrate-binding protein [Desulfatitalea alkaliphila]MCJ8499756.1 ABC transporter substrate-binding protein [Desulfatitalea alkaliphila]